MVRSFVVICECIERNTTDDSVVFERYLDCTIKLWDRKSNEKKKNRRFYPGYPNLIGITIISYYNIKKKYITFLFEYLP